MIGSAPSQDSPGHAAPARSRETLQLGLRAAALATAVWGGAIVASANRHNVPADLFTVGPWWAFGFLLWAASECVLSAHPLRDRRRPHSSAVAGAAASCLPLRPIELFTRVALGAIGLVLCFLTWHWTLGNQVTLSGFITWIASMGVAAWVCAPRGWSPRRVLVGPMRSLRRISFAWNWKTLTFAAIVIMGAVFRFTDVAGTPPEMTSDHVEKLLDALRVTQGDRSVFFFRNGGREPIQMYLMAALSQVPGLGINFYTLKLLTAIEGVITLPFIFFMARAVVGREDPPLGTLTGLMTMALVATSRWHQTLSHLGLRIVLTPLVVAVLLTCLTHAFRTNRRSHFVGAGLVLGIGLYTYQAIRIMPLVVLVGLAVACAFRVRRRTDLGPLLLNAAAMAIVTVVAWVPLLRYAAEFPDVFFARTHTRVFGDAMSPGVDAPGMVQWIWSHRDVLTSNIGHALLAYNFKGDVAWLQNVPFYPLMDAVTGALLIGGVAAWVAFIVRRRDPMVDLWLPLCVLLLLPSALAVAFPIENPSATRLSASLPGVYLLAGFALALIARQVGRAVPGRLGRVVATVTAALVVGATWQTNWRAYFGDYRRAYAQSTYAAYSDAGRVLRAFARAGSGYGNAFVVAFPYWWDYRAVGIEGGAPNWPGGIFDPDGNSRQLIPTTLIDAQKREGEFRFDPDSDILFFYEPTDDETQALLLALFPGGHWQLHDTYLPGRAYKTFRVGALGEDGWRAFLTSDRRRSTN